MSGSVDGLLNTDAEISPGHPQCYRGKNVKKLALSGLVSNGSNISETYGISVPTKGL